jgi:hypothetical protein
VPKQMESEATKLGDLLEFVAQCPEDEPDRVVQEHLSTAYQFRAIGLHPEYVQELEFARLAAESIADRGDRTTVDRLIGELIATAETN